MRQLWHKLRIKRTRYISVSVFLLVCFLLILYFDPIRIPSHSTLQAQMQLSTRKDVYCKGEPIIVDIFIFNAGNEFISVDSVHLCYPIAEAPGQEGVYFDANAAGLDDQSQDEMWFPSILGHFLASGDTYRETIRLQDFIIQPEAGQYRLPYTIALCSYIDPDPEKRHFLINRLSTIFGEKCFITKLLHRFKDDESHFVVSKGELVFTIKPR